MARRVFFSFHYQRDIFRVNVVRNSGIVEGSAAAGFQDGSLWEETKKKGDAAVKRLIDRGLEGTSVTAVLIGAQTSNRQYVDYEIEQSINRGNGLLGIYIHQISIPFADDQGAVPWRLSLAQAPVYHWDRTKFGDWVEQAYHRAQSDKLAASIGGISKALASYGAPRYQPEQVNPTAWGDILKKYMK